MGYNGINYLSTGAGFLPSTVLRQGFGAGGDGNSDIWSPRIPHPQTSMGFGFGSTMIITLPETNIAPENRVSQKETTFPTNIFQGLC